MNAIHVIQCDVRSRERASASAAVGPLVGFLCVLCAAVVSLFSACPADAAPDSLPPAMVDSGRVIRAEAVVAAPIAEVWNSWTTSEGVTGFLEVPSRIEARVGGAYEIYFSGMAAPEGQRGSEGCTVLSYLPERMLSFSWNAPPKFPAIRGGPVRTIVVVELTPMGKAMTGVRLTHHGWPGAGAAIADIDQWNGAFEYFQKAWPNVLQALAAHHAPKDAEKNAPLIDPKQGWVYMVSPARPDLLQTMTEEEKRLLGEHAAYIKRLAQEGTVIVAGPCTDMRAPGLVIFQAEGEAAARAIMEGDAAVRHGVFKAELHPMRLSFMRGRD